MSVEVRMQITIAKSV